MLIRIHVIIDLPRHQQIIRNAMVQNRLHRQHES